jgi:predicted metalloendopeptidase
MSLENFLDKYFNKTFTKAQMQATLKQVSANASVSAAMQLNMTVNVVNPDYYRQLDNILYQKLKGPNAAAGNKFLANYFGWRMLQTSAKLLSQLYRDALLEFDKVYSGVTEESPRWQTCVRYTNSAMKLATGSIYVQSYFGMNAKAKVCPLVDQSFWMIFFRALLRKNK